ncbi:MAG: hypothetical protein AB8B99_23605 [Phormidesmis sp.]
MTVRGQARTMRCRRYRVGFSAEDIAVGDRRARTGRGLPEDSDNQVGSEQDAAKRQ